MIVIAPTPSSAPVACFTSPDTLTTTDNVLIPWLPGRGQTVDGATAQVKTAPVGADITIAIKVITRSTGATASTLGTITIADGTLQGTITFASTQIADTQALAAEITQVGSGTPGANLTVEVYGPASAGGGGGGSSFVDKGCRVAAGSDQDVLNGADDAVNYATTNYDVGGCHNTTGVPFVVPSGQGGKWKIEARASFYALAGVSPNVPCTMYIESSIQGSLDVARVLNPSDSETSSLLVSTEYELAAGETITIHFTNGSGQTIRLQHAVAGAKASVWASFRRVG